jgi:cell filamentation protein
VFDPFGDFRTAGYLRNIEALKDLEMVKVQEHVFFEANLEEAMTFLRKVKGPIEYKHFLKVHRILFGEFYPWSGRDRYELGVGRLVGKGGLVPNFEDSVRCQQAVEWGLRMGNDAKTLREQPGTVMGAFAWGHPFLDGNGRTMLLVHAELCHRAAFAIDWRATQKAAYLEALTQEIVHPQGKPLDRYLLPHVVPAMTARSLLEHLKALPGLDGQDDLADENVAYEENDPQAIDSYLETKRARGESVDDGPVKPQALSE